MIVAYESTQPHATLADVAAKLAETQVAMHLIANGCTKRQLAQYTAAKRLLAAADGAALTPALATAIDAIARLNGLRAAPALRAFPVACPCAADGQAVYEHCDLCAGTGYTATPTGAVAPIGESK